MLLAGIETARLARGLSCGAPDRRPGWGGSYRFLRELPLPRAFRSGVQNPAISVSTFQREAGTV